MDETKNALLDLVNSIPVTIENEDILDEIREAIEDGDLQLALEKMDSLPSDVREGLNSVFAVKEEETKTKRKIYPEELSNEELEETYIGLLLDNPEAIVKYYFVFEECYFENEDLLNLYKRILFTDGEAYAPEKAKKGFNFPRDDENTESFAYQVKQNALESGCGIEETYIDLKKLFVLRKHYIEVPIKHIQDNIVEIANYELYHEMSVEEVENAVEQVNATNKFKRAVLNMDLTKFLQEGDNNLTNGLSYPFPILTNVFKGIRKGETTAFAMPSNAGKSRFTVNIAAYTAFVHKKKVLVISNEMSEEKMRLCLITTILNNPEIQKIHGYKLHKTEGELLQFKFRPDEGTKANLDENGFIVQEEKETKKEFVKRLLKISTEFKQTIAVTDWVNKEMKNSMYFINITDHTNDELRKVIMNYYYKEKIEYVFYDTLKTDVENIGNGEELKKTATILSNLAQNFDMFIFETLQLAESSTLPVNLNVNDLAVSRTVKEVLDTLCLIKQINPDNYEEYEYSKKEVDTKFYNIEKSKDPDVRYYACVVDKNRAGAKPKLVFKLNLAYNSWEELGYVRLKQKNK